MLPKWFILVSFLVLVAACGTTPTPYQKEKKDEGYTDNTQDDLRITTFKANHYTKTSKARLFAEFRTIERCHKDGYKYANILDIFDKTISKEVTKTDSNVYGPSYYGGYGMYPFYSRYSSFGVGVNFSNVSSRTWNETYTYPHIEIPYLCADKIYRPKMMFREVPAEEMKHLVKDIKGGIQIEKIMDDSPNKKVLQNDDIILRVNDERVERVYEIIRLFNEKRRAVTVVLLREGKKRELQMKAVDVTEIVGNASQKIIQEACKEKSILEKYKDSYCKKE